MTDLERNRQFSQKGFAHLEFIIALVIIGAISFIGYRVFIMSHADSLAGTITGIGSKCLDNSNGLVKNYNPVILFSCNGTAAQKWTMTTSGTIANSGYCLDVPSASKISGTAIQIYQCNGTVAQQWRRTTAGGLINLNSKLCLDDKWAVTTNGNPITIYGCNGSAAQTWKVPATGSLPPVTAPTAPVPTPAPVLTGPSGQAMPVGNVGGFTQTFAEDFKINAPIGQFQSAYANSWCGYNESGKYFNNKVISAHDGVMDFNLDGKIGGAGSFGQKTICHGQVYGRFVMRVKAVNASGNGTAIMVWPSSNIWGDGEIDYPEGSFQQSLGLYHHPMGCTNCSSSDALDTKASWQTWHTVATEWVPGAVRYYLDGNLIKTVTHDVPTTNHRYTIQMAPTNDTPQTGNFLVDWVAIYSRN